MPTSTITITSGHKYIDIDAYASMIVYRELLKASSNYKATTSTTHETTAPTTITHSKVTSTYDRVIASTTATQNQSIPPLISNLKYSLDSPTDTPNSDYIILDVSNPSFFDKQVKINRLVEIIDHHTGFEEYWSKHPKVHCQIEFIGSVCTLIYEKIIQSGKTKILDPDLCKLLLAGILDNTLNLKASITTKRDHLAYNQLLKIGNIPNNYYIEYFTACQSEIMKNFVKSIENDLKIEKAGTLPEVIGQMIILNINDFDYAKMKTVFAKYPEWMMNVILLQEGKSYIYFGGKNVKQRLEYLFKKVAEQDDLLILDQFLLRKQIMKKARNASTAPR